MNEKDNSIQNVIIVWERQNKVQTGVKDTEKWDLGSGVDVAKWYSQSEIQNSHPAARIPLSFSKILTQDIFMMRRNDISFQTLFSFHDTPFFPEKIIPRVQKILLWNYFC